MQGFEGSYGFDRFYSVWGLYRSISSNLSVVDLEQQGARVDGLYSKRVRGLGFGVCFFLYLKIQANRPQTQALNPDAAGSSGSDPVSCGNDLRSHYILIVVSIPALKMLYRKPILWTQRAPSEQ